MSMELYVLSDSRLSTIQDWQRSIDVMGSNLQLSTMTPFAKLSGTLPVELAGAASLFECSHWDVEDVMRTFADVTLGRRWNYALAFRWGADFDAAISAYLAAAGYARAVSGTIFDCQEGTIISSLRAVEIANQMQHGRPEMEAAIRAAVDKIIAKRNKK